MNDLINTHENENGELEVSGRELHEFLEVGTPYDKWFPRMTEYGFSEETDFNLDKNVRVQKEGSREVSRNIIDHRMTITMAKELCMLQRTDRGKQARQYFLQLEQAWNTPEMVMARAIKMADKTIHLLKTDNARLVEQNTELMPKGIFADSVSASDQSILVGQMAKILKQNGVDTGEKRFYAWLRENGYLIKRKGTDYNKPTQRSMEMGLFIIKETAVAHSSGFVSLSITPKITGKGQIYFVNKLKPALALVASE